VYEEQMGENDHAEGGAEHAKEEHHVVPPAAHRCALMVADTQL